jgi:hypothetical protein
MVSKPRLQTELIYKTAAKKVEKWESPGTIIGQMQYWDGDAWVLITVFYR